VDESYEVITIYGRFRAAIVFFILSILLYRYRSYMGFTAMVVFLQSFQRLPTAAKLLMESVKVVEVQKWHGPSP